MRYSPDQGAFPCAHPRQRLVLLRAVYTVRYANGTPGANRGRKATDPGRLPPPAMAGLPYRRCLPRVTCPSVRRSASAQGVHDLDPVAFAQRVFPVAAARQDFPVDLDRDATFSQSLGLEQLQHGQRSGEQTRLSIQDDVHGAIVVRDGRGGQRPCRAAACAPRHGMVRCGSIRSRMPAAA